MSATYQINTEKNGVEITFDAIPGEEIRGALKESGFRWHKVNKYWYAPNNSETLRLAQRLTGNERLIEEEKACERGAALTVERLNAIKEGYTFREKGEGLYAGWEGNNCAHVYGQELKKAIIAELKKNGIKATARSTRGGWTDKFYFCVTVPEECRTSRADYIDEQRKSHLCRYWYTDKNGESVHESAFWKMSGAEQNEVTEATFGREWDNAQKDGGAAGASEAFRQTVRAIVDSFNYDCSNSMIDYFDTGFYWDVEYKYA